jgi:hypothetical protein
MRQVNTVLQPYLPHISIQHRQKSHKELSCLWIVLLSIVRLKILPSWLYYIATIITANQSDKSADYADSIWPPTIHLAHAK